MLIHLLTLNDQGPAQSFAVDVEFAWCNLDDFSTLLESHLSCLSLVDHLLRTVRYTYTATCAQIDVLVFHPTGWKCPDVIKDIMWFGRLINFVVAKSYHDTICLDDEICVEIVPHTGTTLGASSLEQSYLLREGQLITATTRNGVKRRLSYTYVGHCEPLQPSFCHSLISKELPLEVADRMIAILLHLGWIHDVRDVVFRKQNFGMCNRSSPSNKQHFASSRQTSITDHKRGLSSLYPAADDMKTALFPHGHDIPHTMMNADAEFCGGGKV